MAERTTRPNCLIISPDSGRLTLNLGELWEYRELIYFLVWRDIKLRYKQTVLGVAWALLQPLMLMAAFSLLLGQLAQVSSEGVPYPVFTFCALLPWQLFAHALSKSSASLVADENLITKVYFPRLAVPLAAVLSGSMDFAITFAILIGLMCYYGITPTIAVWTVPVFVLLTLSSALAAGLWLSTLNVKYRDVRHTIPFLTQFWLFVSPVAYPSSLMPESWRWVYALNPMTGVIEGFRWALLGRSALDGSLLALSLFVMLLLLVGGLYYFRRMEQDFADIV